MPWPPRGLSAHQANPQIHTMKTPEQIAAEINECAESIIRNLREDIAPELREDTWVWTAACHAKVIKEDIAALTEHAKGLEARILADNKAYGCELRDPNGTIWEYAETLKKRISELELQTFDIKALEADKARLDAGLTKLYDELEGYEDGAPDAGPKSQLANACLPTIRSLLAIVRAAIDTARTAQPAANTGDNHRTEDKL